MDFKKTMDDAIKTCDKVEYDPQDIKYAERSIKGLQSVNIMLNMVRESRFTNASKKVEEAISILKGVK